MDIVGINISGLTDENGTITYEYDAFGNRSLLKDGNTETTYA